jgi:hypothetical protein
VNSNVQAQELDRDERDQMFENPEEDESTVYLATYRQGHVKIEKCMMPDIIPIPKRQTDSMVAVVMSCVDEGMKGKSELLYCLGKPTYAMLEGAAKRLWHATEFLELTATARDEGVRKTMILDRDNTAGFFLRWANCGFTVQVRIFKHQLAEITYYDASEYANAVNATFIDDESAVFQLLNPEALIAQNAELCAECDEVLDFTVLMELLKWQSGEVSDPMGLIRAIAQSTAEVVNCIYCIRDYKSVVSVRTNVPIIGDRAEGRVDFLLASER